MNIGIIVEQERDKAAYRELIRKIRDDVESVPAEPCGNDIKLMENFVGWLKHFQWHAEISVNKALVISDSDCSDPVAWESKMEQILTQSHFVPSFPVTFMRPSAKSKLGCWLTRTRSIRSLAIAGSKGRFQRLEFCSKLIGTPRNYFRKSCQRCACPLTPRSTKRLPALRVLSG